MSITHQVPNSLRDVIVKTLENRLNEVGLRHIDIEEGEDFEGDAVLFVDIEFDLTQSALDPARFRFLTSDVREALESVGESRFPHLRFQFHEKQKIAAVP